MRKKPKKQSVTELKEYKGGPVPKLGSDIAFLLCEGDCDGGYRGMNRGDFSIQLFGNTRGFRKLGRYFLALAKFNTSDHKGIHDHFFQVTSLSKTKIDLTVYKNKTADIEGMI